MDLIITILPLVTKDLPSLPGSRLTIFYRDASSALLQLVNEFYLLTFPRFPIRKKEHKSYFGKNRTHDFRTSRCAGYLPDHSGDIFLTENAPAYSHHSSSHYDGSRPEPHSLDIKYNPLPGDKYGDEDAGNGGQACPNTWVKLVARSLA